MNRLTGIKDFERDGEKTTEVYITTGENEYDTNLFDFCNDKCKEKCNQSWDIEDIFGGFECSDCPIAYMYHFGVRLCTLEHTETGDKWYEKMKIL